MDHVRYWNTVGAEKRFSAPFDLGAFARFVPPTARVLDLGCGYGRTMAELARAGYGHVLGLDPSAALLARGRREHPGLALALADGRTLPCACGRFGAVLVVGVLTALPRDEDQDRLLAEARRVLAPGGVLGLGDFALNADPRNLERYERGLARHGVYGVFDLPGGGVARHHSPERIRAMTGPDQTLHLAQAPWPTMNGHVSNGFFFLGRRPDPANPDPPGA